MIIGAGKAKTKVDSIDVMRFIENNKQLTQLKVAKHFGISQSRVSQIRRKNGN